MPVVVTRSEHETEDAGRAFSARLQAGDVVLLDGPLGAGKTAFVRGLAAGLGADPAQVTSPTFTILHEYAGASVTLFHADLYRLTPKEVEDLGLADVSADGVLAVEWPERWSAPPANARRVVIAKSEPDDAGADVRTITLPVE